jgi:hypothetical protein
MYWFGCGPVCRLSFFRRQNNKTAIRINMTIGKPTWLRSKMRKMENSARKNKKMVKMISRKVSSVRRFPSFSKGSVALDPQAGQ